jgi:hypothetical protein
MKKIFLMFIAILVVCSGQSFGQDYKMLGLYVINFAKYVVWPAEAAGQGNFIITVLGDDPIVDQLKSLAAETQVGTQKIIVNKSLSLDKTDKCNILFIAPDKSNQLPGAIAKFSSGNTLIVTRKEGLAREGAAINLVTVDGKLMFEINVDGLKKCGLSAKPVLFKLGRTI